MNAMVGARGRDYGRCLLRIAAVIQGESRLVLGRPKPSDGEEGTGGIEVDVSAGDVVVVPAGVSHRSLTSSGAYRYIGVYPEVSQLIDRQHATELIAVRRDRNGATTTARARNRSTTSRSRSLTWGCPKWILCTASMDHWSRSGGLLLVECEAV
jgi:uridine phosphorylase